MDKIEFRTGEVQGYGGRGYQWIQVTYQNKLLDYKKFYSSEELGYERAHLEIKWNQLLKSPVKFLRAIANKPDASKLCSHCGGNTLDGCISCVDKYFCNKCESFIEQYKKEYRDKVVADQARWRQEQEQKESQRTEAVKARLTGFHWRDDWYFKRLVDGSVNIIHFHRGPSFSYIDKDLVIPSNEWASIVCSVSRDGETSERWNASQDFHGRIK
jgi:hypothetical protein